MQAFSPAFIALTFGALAAGASIAPINARVKTGELRVLLDDMNPDVLVAKGYRTLEATTGGEAVALAAEHSPDLVLMDIQLPDIDGVEALGRLRADGRTVSMPVIALTAQAMEGDRERFLAAGFDGYISKPVNIAEFVATVKRYCEEGSR